MTECSQCGAEINAVDTFCSTCGTNTDAHTDSAANTTREPLLIEWISSRAGFDRVTNRSGTTVSHPYLFVGTGIVVAFVLLPLYSYLTTGYHTALENPFRPVVVSAALVFAVAGIRYMTDEYHQAVEKLDLDRRASTPHETEFDHVVSLRWKKRGYGLFVLAYYLSIFVPTVTEWLGIGTGSTVLTALSGRGIQTLLEAEGALTTVVGQLIIVPLVNVPVVLEFAFVFFGLNFALPRKIHRADIELFFHDPRNMGGFNDIGQLLKRSYYVYTGAVLLYFIVAYSPVLFSSIANTPRPTPGTDVIVTFTAIWLFGLVSIVYSFSKLHQVMIAQKEQRLTQIESDIKELIDDPFDIRASRVVDKEVMETKQRQLDQVRSTRTYPATFTMWWQIGLSVLLPQALQLATQSIL
jgi:hypothetical protein